MKQLVKKITESKTLLAFLLLFSPLIISVFIFSNGESLGISDDWSFLLAGIFYPYLQIVIWIYWMWYAANRLVENNQIDQKYIENFNKVFRFSRIAFIILFSGFIINSIMPKLIQYPKLIEEIVLYFSYGWIFLQLYIFFAWIYGYWITTKTLNQIYDKNGKEMSMSMILFCFMPFTFGVIHQKIRRELN